VNNDPTQSVFDLVLLRPVDRRDGPDPALAHLWWVAPEQGERLVQVYVNSVLYDVTLHAEQREMWLGLDRRKSLRIELLAVHPDEPRGVWTARPELLQSWSPPMESEAQLALSRDPSLPIDTQITLQVDGETLEQTPLWSAATPRGGFGALFGEGGFGLDGATGPGLGLGELGFGPLGSDGSAWRWRRGDIVDGPHALRVEATDRGGRPVALPLEESIELTSLPEPAKQIEVSDDFTLQWS